MKITGRILLFTAGMVIVLAVMFLTGHTAMAAGGFAGGTGEAGTPWEIETPEQLATVAEAVYSDSHFKLTADIDLTGYLSEGGGGWNDGAGWQPIGTQAEPFTGSFDGCGYTITDLFINRSGTDYQGLFGYIGDTAVIQNVILDNVDVTGAGSVGGLTGYNNGGDITACSAAGEVAGVYGNIGGLVGYNSQGTIADSYATTTVTGDNRNSHYIGGLVGSNSGTVIGSYATGAVTGDMSIGGLVGVNESYISNSYAAGSVSSQGAVGGLVGYSDGGTVTGSYYDSDTTGQSDTGKGQPKNTVEMKQQATFVGWDFTEQGAWRIFENNNYPVLRWQRLTPQEIDAKISIDIDCDALEIIYAEGDSADRVTRDLTLPQTGSNGTTISWSSSNVLVIADDGTVTRPDDGNKTITMTATVSKAGGADRMKEFQLTVEAIPIYALTIASGTGGSITTGSYAEGTVIDISAAPNSGYKFNKWTTTNGGTFGNANSASTTFTMPANATTITATFTYTGSGGGNGGRSGTSAPAPTYIAPSPTYIVDISGIDTWGTAIITLPSIPGVNAYTLSIPAVDLSTSQGEGALAFSTDAGSITIPYNILSGISGVEGKKAGITIGQGDKSSLSDKLKAAIGDRPMVHLSMTLDGEQVEWKNPGTPVTVSIPYTPTAQELANPEHITVWYIDGAVMWWKCSTAAITPEPGL